MSKKPTPSRQPKTVKQVLREQTASMRLPNRMYTPLGMVGAPLAIVGFRPNDAKDQVFSGPSHELWRQMIADTGVNPIRLLWQTYLVKSEPMNQDQLPKWRKVLFAELDIVKPRAVLLLGGLAAKHVLGLPSNKTADYRGTRYALARAKYATFFVTHSVEEVVTSHDDLSVDLRQDFAAVAFGDPDRFPLTEQIGGADATRPTA